MKKGFTLIELLAVIVILAIIAIIATPIILDIIDDSKKSAATESAKLYTSGLQTKIATMNLENEFNPSVCTIANGAVSCDGVTINYELNGEKPTSGTINFTNGVLSSYSLCVSGFRVAKSGNNVTTTKDATCSAEPVYTYTSPGLYRNGALVYSWDDLCSLGLITLEQFAPEHDEIYIGIHSSETLNGYLYIDDSIDYIQDGVFNSVGLTGVTLPSNITVIGYNTFANNQITSVELPDSVGYIGFGAFANNQITSINIPASVEEINERAFMANPLTSITVDSNNPYYDSRDNCNAIIYTDEDILIQGSRNAVIPNDVHGIYNYAFYGLGLTSFSLPSNITDLGERVFANNPLTSITVDPNNQYFDSRDNCNAIIYTENNSIVQASKNTVMPSDVTAIWDGAYEGLGLTSITIPNTVEEIGGYAFANNRLTSITIPDSVEYIGFGAFAHNQISSVNIPANTGVELFPFAYNPLTSITVDSNNPYYDSRDNSNAIIRTEDNAIVQGSRNTVIPSTVTAIWDGAFEGVGISSITIPNNVAQIEDAAFANNQLTSITIPSSITELKSDVFKNNRLTSVTLSTGLLYIRDGAFANNQISSVTLPSGTKSINDSAFKNNQLTSITIPSTVTTIGYNAFANNRLTSVTFSEGIENIGGGAFANNRLTSLEYPNNYAPYVEFSAFANNQITSINLLGLFLEARSYAFANNPLTSITAPNNTTWTMFCDIKDIYAPTSFDQSIVTTINNNGSCKFALNPENGNIK